MWGAAVLLAVAAAGCASSPQSMIGTAPSAVGSLAASADSGALFGALKEGRGKDKDRGPDKGETPAPTPPATGAPGAGTTPATGTTPPAGTTPPTGTTPDADDDDHRGDRDADEPDHRGPGHGRATQIEGIAMDVTGKCPMLTIMINGQTVKTDARTDFQRGDCRRVEAGMRLHIAGSMHDGSFVADYVRMQGRRLGDDEDDDDDDDDTVTPPPTGTTPPPAGTAPTTGTTPAK